MPILRTRWSSSSNLMVTYDTRALGMRIHLRHGTCEAKSFARTRYANPFRVRMKQCDMMPKVDWSVCVFVYMWYMWPNICDKTCWPHSGLEVSNALWAVHSSKYFLGHALPIICNTESTVTIFITTIEPLIGNNDYCYRTTENNGNVSSVSIYTFE